jgi:hypothetical protein
MNALSLTNSHEKTLAEFKTQVRQNTFQGLCGRSYVQVARLKKWLDLKKVEILLDYAYLQRESLNPPIREYEVVCEGTSCCALVFSILLELGQGHHIDWFAKRELGDIRLPIPLSTLKDEGVEYAEAFVQKQWAFCPATFKYKSQNYTKDRILPICTRQLISDKVGTAQVSQIIVPEDFVEHGIRAKVPDSKFKFDEKFGDVS